VRILLDEHLPRLLANALLGHEVRTVHQQGWAGLRNGDLLDRASAGTLSDMRVRATGAIALAVTPYL
jgi:hypothetical protein